MIDSKADILVYGMGEKQIVAVAERLDRCAGDGRSATPVDRFAGDIPQVAYLAPEAQCKVDGVGCKGEEVIELHSHEEAVKSKRVHAENFRLIEIESNKINAATIIQPVGDKYVVVNPPYPTMTTEELDAIYDLPFMYHPHPKYKGKHIPAYEMIRFSVCMHRGCFGACSF